MLLERIGAGFSSLEARMVVTMRSAVPEAASQHQIADVVMRVSRAGPAALGAVLH